MKLLLALLKLPDDPLRNNGFEKIEFGPSYLYSMPVPAKWSTWWTANKAANYAVMAQIVGL